MKILHIHPSMRSGGIEAMICALANEMSKTDSVTVCSIFAPLSGDLFWNKLSPKVQKYNLGKTRSGFSLKEIFSVFNLIRRGGFDVVNMHGMFAYYVLSVLLLHNKTHFFYTVHSDAVMENSRWDRKILAVKRFCFLRKYVTPITISNASQNSFKNLYHCSSILIYNGIAKPDMKNSDFVAKYRFSPQTRVFIHAGRIDTPKNQLVLCKVFRHLIEDGEDVVLLIAGSKRRSDIFDSIKSYFCDRIVYLGERNDITQLMASCDAMCLPSLWEGLPVTLLEAISVGCVPICSNVGGISEVITSGINGILSESPSEDDFYSSVKQFLELSVSERLSMSQHCRESFYRFDIANTSREYINAYKSVLRES